MLAKSTSLALLLLLVTPVAWAGAGEARAADEKPPARDCLVGVRLIRATQQQNAPMAVGDSAAALPSEVSARLAALPFASYHAVAFQERTIPVRQREVFSLSDVDREKHTLSVRVLDLTGDKVRVSMKWKDPRGDRLVSARMRVTNGQNMILGTDRSEDVSSIMSVKFNCK